jgi:hypothetical protein
VGSLGRWVGGFGVLVELREGGEGDWVGGWLGTLGGWV